MYTLHYGHLAFKDLWAELKLPEFIGKLQQDSTDITSWQLSDFIFYLTAMKAMEPRSLFFREFHCYYSAPCFFYCPWITIPDITKSYYAGLDFFAAQGPSIISHVAAIHRVRQARSGRKANVLADGPAWFAFDPMGYPVGCQAGSGDEALETLRERLQQLGFTTIEVKTDDQLPQKTSRSWCELADNQDWEILPPNEQHRASEQAARCYLAVLSLMVLKELQAKLNAAGVKLTLERISAALKDSQFMVEHGTQDDEMVLMPCQHTYHENKVHLEQIFAALGLGIPTSPNSLAILKEDFKLQDIPDHLLISEDALEQDLT